MLRETGQLYRASEGPWTEEVINEYGELRIWEGIGVANRTAAHLAAALLTGARGGVALKPDQKRRAAFELGIVYRECLGEEPPASLVALAAG